MLDIGQQFLLPNGELPRKLMSDFCHPTEEGYAIWAAALRPLLQDAGPSPGVGTAPPNPRKAPPLARPGTRGQRYPRPTFGRCPILPGDMKDLMNKVTEAKKAAEANLIVRREATAAMRSQANTAKVLEGNPTLMRLRELEVLERVATGGKLNVVLGEKGLAERVVNLL